MPRTFYDEVVALCLLSTVVRAIVEATTISYSAAIVVQHHLLRIKDMYWSLSSIACCRLLH